MDKIKVLVKSFPSEPLIREIYEEKENCCLVWRGTKSIDDVPSPCPKNKVYIVDNNLIEMIQKELSKSGEHSEKVQLLWNKAIPLYK